MTFICKISLLMAVLGLGLTACYKGSADAQKHANMVLDVVSLRGPDLTNAVISSYNTAIPAQTDGFGLIETLNSPDSSVANTPFVQSVIGAENVVYVSPDGAKAIYGIKQDDCDSLTQKDVDDSNLEQSCQELAKSGTPGLLIAVDDPNKDVKDATFTFSLVYEPSVDAKLSESAPVLLSFTLSKGMFKGEIALSDLVPVVRPVATAVEQESLFNAPSASGKVAFAYYWTPSDGGVDIPCPSTFEGTSIDVPGASSGALSSCGYVQIPKDGPLAFNSDGSLFTLQPGYFAFSDAQSATDQDESFYALSFEGSSTMNFGVNQEDFGIGSLSVGKMSLNGNSTGYSAGSIGALNVYMGTPLLMSSMKDATVVLGSSSGANRGRISTGKITFENTVDNDATVTIANVEVEEISYDIGGVTLDMKGFSLPNGVTIVSNDNGSTLKLTAQDSFILDMNASGPNTDYDGNDVGTQSIALKTAVPANFSMNAKQDADGNILTASFSALNGTINATGTSSKCGDSKESLSFAFTGDSDDLFTVKFPEFANDDDGEDDDEEECVPINELSLYSAEISTVELICPLDITEAFTGTGGSMDLHYTGALGDADYKIDAHLDADGANCVVQEKGEMTLEASVVNE